MKKWILLAQALALGAVPAGAATGWFSSSGCNGAPLSAPRLSQSGPVYYCIDSTTTVSGFSPVLLALGVRWFSVERHADTNQVSAGACTVKLWRTVKAAGTAVSVSTGLTEISGDSDGDGVQNDLALSGAANLRVIHDIRTHGLTVQTIAAAAASEQCVIAFMAGQ